MDPVRNPFAPGAGNPPPELAGRAEIIEGATVALRRVAQKRSSQSHILTGLRGVGKTVLLNEIRKIAESEHYLAIQVEAHEGKALAELIVPGLRQALIKLSAVESAKQHARRALRVLRSFIGALKVKIFEAEFSINAEPGSADSGDIEADLPDLIVAVGEAAQASGRPLIILIDELQYLEPEEFSALIMAMHAVNQRSLPLFFLGAGLPQILGLAGNSKSYAERLFVFPKIGALAPQDATVALARPIMNEGATISGPAIVLAHRMTQNYPYFLQQWGHEAWNIADDDKITEEDMRRATPLAYNALDQSFFRVRFDRCTPSEKQYMRALAEFNEGRGRSGDVAETLGVKVTSVAPTRSNLIKKGMVYSPAHGVTAFTVPLFHIFMQREIPKFANRRKRQHP
jgi:hypothetical protein